MSGATILVHVSEHVPFTKCIGPAERRRAPRSTLLQMCIHTRGARRGAVVSVRQAGNNWRSGNIESRDN